PIVGDESTLLRGDVNAWRARPPTLWGYLGQLAAAAGWTSLPRLHRITAPTMIISGTADPIVPPVNARLLARRIPSPRVELIHGAGHLVLMDVAERCATTIADFFDDQTTAA